MSVTFAGTHLLMNCKWVPPPRRVPAWRVKAAGSHEARNNESPAVRVPGLCAGHLGVDGSHFTGGW
jgi:hypothetical protein